MKRQILRSPLGTGYNLMTHNEEKCIRIADAFFASSLLFAMFNLTEFFKAQVFKEGHNIFKSMYLLF
jgi:hypothetical protein